MTTNYNVRTIVNSTYNTRPIVDTSYNADRPSSFQLIDIQGFDLTDVLGNDLWIIGNGGGDTVYTTSYTPRIPV